MSGYNPFAAGFNGDNMQHMDPSTNGNNTMMMGEDGMDNVGGQSLDDIVNQNATYFRRQSIPQRSYSHNPSIEGDMRRVSMMEFGTNPSSVSLENFHFDPSLQDDMLNNSASMAQSNQAMQAHARRSTEDQSMNNGFANSSHAYAAMMQSSAGNNGSALDMDMNNSYFANQMGMGMDFGNANLNNIMSGDPSMNMYSQAQFNSAMMGSPMAPNTTNTLSRGMSQVSGAGISDQQRPQFDSDQGRSSSDPRSQPPQQSQSMTNIAASQRTPQQQQQKSSPPQPQRQDASSSAFPTQAQPQYPQPESRPDSGASRGREQSQTDSKATPTVEQPFETPEGGWPSTISGRPHMQTGYKNIYSSTGFDMLGVLMRIATRPNPEINIGSVDLSCAFVVCDAEKDDIPIVYCSDNFERLTGYTRHMILGRNCRFLQAPDGQVESGVRRKYVDDDSVLYLKNMVNSRKESQISLINYRRGGQPFMNLLTVIPITWDSDQVKFFVGFQVDLVEQPNAVTNRNPDGSYAINYQRGMTMPRYIPNAPESQVSKAELGQTIPRDDVSAILSTIGTGESEYAKRMWDKVILENTDDIVHVLSLKGLFQWVSPSAFKVLEYEPGEIIGTALSSLCHPSDIVPVTRELKDTSSGAPVNVVFRIRRKNSGYMWFEGHGSLHTEQGKGRKSIIMVGRERPVYTLSKTDIINNGGIGENELWTKMSTSGMFLYVSSNVRQLLDRQPEDLIGISIQSMMRSESKAEFGRILEHARTGKKASVKHEMINRRGQVLQAFTTLYPGDATEGQKPTFIVAQTRLIKHPRGSATSKPQTFNKGSDSAPAAANMSASSGNATPYTVASSGRYKATDGAAMTYSGHNGLVLGHQDVSLASEDNLFDELKTTKSSSWQYEIRQLEKRNRVLAEEVQTLIAAKKKRKRRKGAGQLQKDCANCHTRVTPEWRRGPSGQRDLCNSCGLRWAKLVSHENSTQGLTKAPDADVVPQNGRVSPRTNSQSAPSDKGSRASASPRNQPLPMPNVKIEAAQTPAAQTPLDNGTQQGQGFHSHASHMEGASGVPEKIMEGVEPE